MPQPPQLFLSAVVFTHVRAAEHLPAGAHDARSAGSSGPGRAGHAARTPSPRNPPASGATQRQRRLSELVPPSFTVGFPTRRKVISYATYHYPLRFAGMTKPVPPATLARLLRARDRLHDAPTEAPTVAALAAEVHLSRAHFLRSFVRAFGVTPHDYRTAVRLDLAKRALARGASVTETCLDAGFSSLGSFSSLFTRRVGVAPRDSAAARPPRAAVGRPVAGDLDPRVLPRPRRAGHFRRRRGDVRRPCSHRRMIIKHSHTTLYVNTDQDRAKAFSRKSGLAIRTRRAEST